MSESMDKVGFSSQEKDNIFRIIAAVMHLGNIAFEEELDDKKGRGFVVCQMSASFAIQFSFQLQIRTISTSPLIYNAHHKACESIIILIHYVFRRFKGHR
jgi:myosin-6